MQLTSYNVGNRSEKGVVALLVILTRSIQLTSYKVGNGSEKGVVILSHFDKINATHIL